MVSDSFEFDPEYDEKVWSGLCGLKELGEDFYLEGFDMSIVKKNGKYGLIYTEHSYFPDKNDGFPIYTEYGVLDCEYDAIYSIHHENFGYFVVVSDNKFGIVQAICTDFDEFYDCKKIMPCIYDRIEFIDSCDVFVLQSEDKVSYYNINTGFHSDNYSGIKNEGYFLFCFDDKIVTIFSCHNDKFVMSSTNTVHYVGIYKNKYIFTEGEICFKNADSRIPIVNGKFCFYKTGNNTVVKTKKLKDISVLKEEKNYWSKIIELRCCGKRVNKI